MYAPVLWVADWACHFLFINLPGRCRALQGRVAEPPPDCNKLNSDCRRDVPFTTLAGIIFAIFFAYFGLFFYYLARAFRQLRAHNYRWGACHYPFMC